MAIRPVDPKQVEIGWYSVESMTRQLITLLEAKDLRKGLQRILAVPRGGFIPATILSHHLDLPITVWAQGWTQGIGDGILVVDDITDTGKTLRLIRGVLPKAVYSTLVVKPQGKPFTDFFTYEVDQDTWVKFPWEVAGKEWTRGSPQ